MTPLREKMIDRAEGALYGLAIGDALGMPSQTLPHHVIRERYGRIEGFVAPFEGHPISHGLKAAQVTDDTEQSLLLAARPEVCGRMVDVGTGAGFPGIVAKLFRPELDLTLMEPTGKRVDFLKYACSALGVEAEFAKERAEEAARKQWRESFDVATARAVAALPVLAEYCLPLLRRGGVFIAMKGSGADEEIDAAQGAVAKLGGKYAGRQDVTLPDGSARTLILYEKISQTPPVYPRNGGKIAKAPLK